METSIALQLNCLPCACRWPIKLLRSLLNLPPIARIPGSQLVLSSLGPGTYSTSSTGASFGSATALPSDPGSTSMSEHQFVLPLMTDPRECLDRGGNSFEPAQPCPSSTFLYRGTIELYRVHSPARRSEVAARLSASCMASIAFAERVSDRAHRLRSQALEVGLYRL